MNDIQDIKNELVVHLVGQLEAMIEFGKALNVTNVTVCRWENGQRMPNVFKILEIAKMGNMTVEEFLS